MRQGENEGGSGGSNHEQEIVLPAAHTNGPSLQSNVEMIL